EQGKGKAMHNLAVLDAVGLEGTPDYKTASQWFQKAADDGIADSQYNRGILYARGVGVEQNVVEAFKWFALAAQQGDKDAARKRDDIAARLDPQALVAARLAVQTFTADPQPDKAIKVEAPGGDWDRALPMPPASKSKAGRRTGASGSARAAAACRAGRKARCGGFACKHQAARAAARHDRSQIHRPLPVKQGRQRLPTSRVPNSRIASRPPDPSRAREAGTLSADSPCRSTSRSPTCRSTCSSSSRSES